MVGRNRAACIAAHRASAPLRRGRSSCSVSGPPAKLKAGRAAVDPTLSCAPVNSGPTNKRKNKVGKTECVWTGHSFPGKGQRKQTCPHGFGHSEPREGYPGRDLRFTHVSEMFTAGDPLGEGPRAERTGATCPRSPPCLGVRPVEGPSPLSVGHAACMLRRVSAPVQLAILSSAQTSLREGFLPPFPSIKRLLITVTPALASLDHFDYEAGFVCV